MIELRREELEIAPIRRAIERPTLGGVVIFCGEVRSITRGKETDHLLYEAYEDMALSEMQKIATEAKERFSANVAMVHRLGRLEVGEIAVITGAACAHRDAAFECCKFLIDSLKANVPIWKKEVGPDGEEWI